RAMDLGLGELPARDLARPLPIVTARTPELVVRRALSEGAPAVIVPGRGTISRAAALRTMPVRARLEKTLSPPMRALLAEISRVAAAQGARAFVAGGLVRDAWRGAAAGGDLDVVVEGDGLAVARALADALCGTLVEHGRFLTASVRAGSHGRIDVATARSARYAAPLELRPDPWTTRCQALALRLAPYAALSGQRIATDLERLLDEPTGPAALAMLARGGVPRLLDPRWRETRGTSARLAAV